MAAFEDWLFDPTVGKIVAVLIGILVVQLLTRWLFQRIVGRVKDTHARYRTRKFVNFISFFLMTVIITVIFSDQLGGLTVALGVAGAGIAFALQEVIVSVAGWFAIIFATFYKVGDRVQLGGIKGDVMDIGVLRTTLMETGEWIKGDQYSGRIVLIANSFVFKEPVFNYSGDFPFLWDEITIPVKYGCDRKLARIILNKVAAEVLGGYTEQAAKQWKKMVKKYLIEDAAVNPMVTLIANDNWMEYTIRYVVEYKKRRSTKDMLFSRILDEFDKTNGQVSIASMTVHLVETPEFKVRMVNAEKPQA